MELALTSDTTSLNYWLTWKFLLCVIWVFTSMIIASYLIWQHEGSGNKETYKEVTQENSDWFPYNDEAWMPCIKGMHPAWWTLSLVAFYFAFGSILSVYGCFRHYKTCDASKDQDYLLPLTHEEDKTSQQAKSHFLPTAAFWGYLFQIIFQMTAGAAMLTDSVYWIVIVPFLTIVGYELGFLTIGAHSLNLVLLLGDTALNSLRFPWFRISYFLLLTAFYVLFEWILHAFVATWWPYPFLDLTEEYAPLWYLLVALLHIPCYSLFWLVVKLTYNILSRWFPQSYQSLR